MPKGPRSVLIAAGVIALFAPLRAPAQTPKNNNPTTAGATIVAGSGSCTPTPASQTPPSVAPVVSNCAVTVPGNGGYTATANAAATAGPGGSVASAATFSGVVPSPLTFSDAQSQYYEYVTL